MQKETSQEKAIPLGNNKHKQNLHIKNSLSLGGEMSQRDREGELALNPRLPHNQRTHPSDCKAGARKSRPLWGKVAPTGDGRGELTLKPRLPPNKDTEPSLPSMELRGLGGELRQVTTTTRFQRNHQPPYFLNSQNHAKITPESTRDGCGCLPTNRKGGDANDSL